MRFKRIACLILALALLLALPMDAMAAHRASIKLGAKLGLMYVGDSAQLKPKLKHVKKADVGFSSSDLTVATVSASGLVEALAPGRAVLEVTGGGAKAKCGVVVLPKQVSMKVGEAVSLPNGTLEQYRSKDPAIASVDDSGVITGLSAGSTLVAVRYGKQLAMVQVAVEADGFEAAPVTVPVDESKVSALDAARVADQIVLVEYTGGSNARLSFHEKINDIWVQRLETSAYVGKNGIGKTKEGDKKTPVGTYNLNTPFGIKADPGAKLSYTQVTQYHYWCGSSKSGYYNQLVDSRETGRSYTSSDEHLIDYKGVYNYCMFIDYNAEGKAGKGSCIFLHCKGKNAYTAGCVAIDEASMKQIIQWAGPNTKIVIQKA